MEAGKIVQVMGPVVDVEFPPGEIPEIMAALVTSNAGIDDRDDMVRHASPQIREHLGLRCNSAKMKGLYRHLCRSQTETSPQN